MDTKEVTFVIPEITRCMDCGEELDICECQVVMIVICPHCRTQAAYKEENNLH